MTDGTDPKIATVTVSEANEAFEICDPMVISETIAKETIVINLNTGNYYSLKGSGATIWSGVEKRSSVATIADIVSTEYEVDATHAQQDVASLVCKLIEEGLVRSAVVAEGSPISGAPSAAREPYVSPLLEKFTDMEAMLLLDPIHDVDERGWPHMPGSDQDGR